MARRRLAPTRWLQIWPRNFVRTILRRFRSGWVPLDTERARAYLASLPKDSQPKLRRESPTIHRQVVAALYASEPAYETLRPRSDRCGTRSEARRNRCRCIVPVSYRYEMGRPARTACKPHSLINAGLEAGACDGGTPHCAQQSGRFSFLAVGKSPTYLANTRGEKFMGFGVPDGDEQLNAIR